VLEVRKRWLKHLHLQSEAAKGVYLLHRLKDSEQIKTYREEKSMFEQEEPKEDF